MLQRESGRLEDAIIPQASWLVMSASEVSRSKSWSASLGGAAQFLGQVITDAAGQLNHKTVVDLFLRVKQI